MNLDELVTLAGKGDAHGKSELATRAIKLVYARAYRSIQDQASADDVTQDALLAALVGLPGLRDPKAFLPWLRRITDNVIADHITGKRDRHSSGSPGPESLPAPGIPVDRSIVKAEELDRVRAALATLEPRSRLAVELFYFQDLTSRQVADFLRISDDAARATLSRSRKTLERRLITMTTTKCRETGIRFSVKGGSAIAGGPVFEPESDTERLYLALYPAGNLDEAADRIGLPVPEAREELDRLRDLRLVSQRGNDWVCTMPVVSETDQELIRLWAEPVLDAISGRLDTVLSEVAAIAELVDGDLAKSTVWTIGLLGCGRLPFDAIQKQMGASSPDRGEFGRFRTAAFTSSPPGQGLLTGLRWIEHSTHDGNEIYTCYYHPQQTNRTRVVSFLRSFSLTDDPSVGRSDALQPLLSRAVLQGLTSEIQQSVEDELEISGDRRDAFWQGLIDLHAVAGDRDCLDVVVPRVPLDAWKDYLGVLEEIGREINDTVVDAAEDLRKRVVRCSFADCYFADSVMAFFTVLEGMVKESLVSRQPLSLPEEADFSWGVLIAA